MPKACPGHLFLWFLLCALYSHSFILAPPVHVQHLRGNRRKPLSAMDGRMIRESSTLILLKSFMKNFTLELIYRARTTPKVLSASGVPKGELLSCCYDTLHGADSTFYSALCPSTMKNFRTLLLEEGMYHLVLNTHIFTFAPIDM